MTGEASLIARVAMGVSIASAGCVAGFLARRSRRFHSLSDRAFLRGASAAFFFSRIALFTAVFLVAHIAPRGDIAGSHWLEAEDFLHHKVQYVDYLSSYAPFHPIIEGNILRLWHTPVALIFVAILIESLTFPLWISLARRFSPGGSEPWIRTASVLYFFSPISWQFNAIDGHDNVHILLLLGAALFLLLLARPVASGASFGLTVICFKFLPLVFAPIYFLADRRRWPWALGFTAIAAPPYLYLAWKHIDFMQALQFEGSLRTPSDLPYLIESLLGVTLSARIWDSLVVISLLALYAYTFRCLRKGQRFLVLNAACAAALIVLVLLSKKSWPNYLPMVLFPLCLVVARLRPLQQAAFYLFSVVAVVEGSFWAYAIDWGSAVSLHNALPHPRAVVFLLLLAALVVGYIALLLATLREMANAGQPPESLPVNT